MRFLRTPAAKRPDSTPRERAPRSHIRASVQGVPNPSTNVLLMPILWCEPSYVELAAAGP